MSLPESGAGFAAAHKHVLLDLAAMAIERGLGGERLAVQAGDFPAPLRAPRASFVTLQMEGALRGCIGSLEARRPLVEDVAANARAAAFDDPRFPALTQEEFDRLDIHISVLSVPERLVIRSEDELLQRLRPGVDGLILEAGRRRGTFLPSVWTQLPEPSEFLRHLKRKAGLPEGYWAEDVRVSRYTTESIP